MIVYSLDILSSLLVLRCGWVLSYAQVRHASEGLVRKHYITANERTNFEILLSCSIYECAGEYRMTDTMYCGVVISHLGRSIWSGGRFRVAFL